MLAEQRQSMILSMVNQRGSLSITEIQRKLKVSRETIRRDLMLLADRQALRKTHGGALSLERSEPEIAVREVINAEGKRAIGRLAASLVPDGATVILASGSTVQSVADALRRTPGPDGLHQQHRQLLKLSGRNKNRVYMLGGEVQAINGATLGRDATSMLSHYFADFVFVGAGAISPDRLADGLHARGGRAAQPDAAVGAHAPSSSPTTASSTATRRCASDNFEKVTHLVTDRQPEAPVAAALAALPLELLVSDGAAGS